MAEMNDSTRRLIMMLTIILAGTAVTFLELSPLVVLVISLLIGTVMLFGLKILSFDELKKDLSSLKDKLNQPVTLKKKDKVKKKEQKEPEEKKPEEKKSRKEKKKDKKKEKDEKAKEDKKKKPSGEKKSFFSGLLLKFKSREKKEDKAKKIDELLDKTINEPGAEASIEEEGEEEEISGAGIDEDDFSDFDSMDLGLGEEDEDLEFGDEPGEPTESESDHGLGGVEDEIPDSMIAEILAKEGIEFELENDGEFPEAGTEGEVGETETAEASDLGELDGDLSGFDLEEDEFEDFDQIDLDEIDTDELPEEEEEEETIDIGESVDEINEAVVAPPEEEEDLFAAPPKEWTQTKSNLPESTEEPVSFEFEGGGDEDDLFAMLKSDTKKAVNIQDTSVVRDLKDTKVETGELVEGLESVLHRLGAKIEKIEDERESKPESESDEEDQI